MIEITLSFGGGLALGIIACRGMTAHAYNRGVRDAFHTLAGWLRERGMDDVAGVVETAAAAGARKR